MAANTASKLPFSDPKAWDNHATQYDDAVGRSSSLGATYVISLAETLEPSLSTPGARAIDLGAGTGSLTFHLARKYPDLPILVTDISPGMLKQVMANPLATPNISTQVTDMRTPVGGAAAEGSFSHIFSTMAIQALYDPAGEGSLAQWARLLKPDGIVAIGVWDFDQNCGPHALWAEAAVAVDPEYVNPPLLPAGHWLGLAQTEEGFRNAGFRDLKAKSYRVDFDVGKEGFLQFFWESGNPMPLERQASFRGDLTKVRAKMELLLDELYDRGKNIELSVGVVVGRRPKLD